MPSQLFVFDVAASSRFFVVKLGFAVIFTYGEPPFFVLVQRDSACLNLRFVHAPVLKRDAERDLLSASIPVANVKALYLEYQGAGAPSEGPVFSKLPLQEVLPEKLPRAGSSRRVSRGAWPIQARFWLERA